MSENDNVTPAPESLYFLEFQFISAFHETEIVKKVPRGDIVYKNLDYQIRARDEAWSIANQRPTSPGSNQMQSHPYFTKIDRRAYPDRVYNSWGVWRGDGTVGPFQQVLQPYQYEPLDLVADFLTNAALPGLRFAVTADLRPDSRYRSWYVNNTGLNSWEVTNNPRITGVGSSNIPKFLEKVVPDQAQNWDSYGIELISPIYSTALGRCETDISAITSTLRTGSDTIGAFITNQCALNVNVDVESLSQSQLATLAWIMVVYEQEIARMHPPCRRPYYPLTRHHPNIKYHAESNRLGFLLDPDIPGPLDPSGPPAKYQGMNAPTTFGDEDVTIEKLSERPLDIHDVREAIERCTDFTELARLLNWPANLDPAAASLESQYGNQNRQMNFARLAELNDYPNVYPQDIPVQYYLTLQFRQAKGSLNDEDILYWVRFCLDLVELAKKYDAGSDPEDQPLLSFKDSINQDGSFAPASTISVFDLMDDMKYSDERKEYWRRRIGRLACYTPGDENDRCDNELPPPNYTYPPPPPPPPPNDGSGDGGDGGGPPDDNNHTPPDNNHNTTNDNSRPPDDTPKTTNDNNRPPPDITPKTTNDNSRPSSPKTTNKTTKRRLSDTAPPDETANKRPKSGNNPVPNRPPGQGGSGRGGAAPSAGRGRGTVPPGQLNEILKRSFGPSNGNGGNGSGGRGGGAIEIDEQINARQAARLRQLADQRQREAARVESEQPQNEAVGQQTPAIPVVPTTPATRAILDMNNLEEGDISCAGEVAIGEDMVLGGAGWKVHNFKPNEWQLHDVSDVIGNRRGACGLRALIRSMQLQYPDKRELGQATPEQLLTIRDSFKRRFPDDTNNPDAGLDVDLLDAVLEEWTNGMFSVVVWDRNQAPNDARRAITGSESRQSMNLYIYFQGSRGADGRIRGHYQAMKRNN